MSALACGPGNPGAQTSSPISATSSDDDSESLTSAETGESDATNTMTSSDTIDDGTTWGCGDTTQTMTETFCRVPGETDGTFGSADGSGTDSATDGATDGATTAATSGATSDATATDTDGELCDAYVGDAPPIDVFYDRIIGSVGPYPLGGQCCWDVTYEVSFPCGRPFFVDERPRVASLRESDEWSDDRDRPEVEALDDDTRERLMAAWLDDALDEHASIAAFARFTLQLLALGAPPDLIADTQRAIADETEHARLCFAIASAYAGRDLGPGGLALHGNLLEDIDLPSVVVATIREGCIGETMAAMQAEVARGLAEDPAVVAALDRIAEDEARHAALAWRFVDWAIKRGGRAIRDIAAEAFDRFAPTPAGNTRGPNPDLQKHGRIGDSDLALLQRRTYDEVIRPCAAAVLAVPAERRPHVLM